MPNKEQSATELISRIRAAIGSSDEFIPLHVPEFSGQERELVLETIDTGWVSSVGSFVNEFEAKIAEECGTKYAVAVSNGTAALELAMRAIGVCPGDEVLMPALTFIATANAAIHIGAIPHFLDSNFETLGVDPEALRSHLKSIGQITKNCLVNKNTGRRISCIIPMHTFGHACEMGKINEIAEEFKITVIEDAAEALGSQFLGKPCGSLSRIAAISFNGNKIITTGGGGAVVTNDELLAKYVKHISTTAKIPHPWAFYHDEPGFNYRMPNINAALGVAQVAQLKERITKKRQLAQKYIEAFSGCKEAEIFKEPYGSLSNYWLNVLLLKGEISFEHRDYTLEVINNAGYMARPAWTILRRIPFLSGNPSASLEVARELEMRIINLPSSAKLAEKI